jgi:hypothetical protein
MYSEHFVYDFNIYSQVVSIGLLGVLFLLLLLRKSKPYYFTIVGVVTVLLNVISMVLYSSIVQEFYINIFSIRGVVLLLIGIFLQSKKIETVKLLSMYFFLELLILQVTSMSDDSIFFMHKTFEANLIGAVIMFVLGLFIPLCMTYLLTESTISSETTVRKQIKIESVLRITSLISVGYLVVLIIFNIPYLFGILIDASRITIIYYQVSALLRIVLYSLLIYTFINLIKDKVKKWLFPVITIVTLVTIIFP